MLARILGSSRLRRLALRLLRNRHTRKAVAAVVFRLLARKRLLRLVVARLRA